MPTFIISFRMICHKRPRQNKKCPESQMLVDSNDGGFILSVLPLRCELKSTPLKYSADTFISSQSCIIFKASIMHERQIN